MGFFQRLNFFFVFVVLGVESINYLETGRELDDRMKKGKKALINCFNMRSIVLLEQYGSSLHSAWHKIDTNSIRKGEGKGSAL